MRNSISTMRSCGNITSTRALKETQMDLVNKVYNVMGLSLDDGEYNLRRAYARYQEAVMYNNDTVQLFIEYQEALDIYERNRVHYGEAIK